MDYINVRECENVYADGVRDDTAALQGCIDTVKSGGTVFFPDGIYLISAALIFYSRQHLRFSDNARVMRSANSQPLTRYLLASYSEKNWSGFSGTHDVVISGGIFDGNESLTEPSTLINTVHCKNILIENCRFVHCAKWHCIEINSTENAVIKNCVFNGLTYTQRCDELHNELIQLDWPHERSYGPVYNCDGALIDFCIDDTACHNIRIESNLFFCDGFPAIGHHDVDCNHRGIHICHNLFDGAAVNHDRSRGYIVFMPEVSGVFVSHNTFISSVKNDGVNPIIVFLNADKEALCLQNNQLIGDFSEIVADVEYL